MPTNRVKEARVEEISCDHGRADYEKRAGCDSTQELSSIVILRSPAAGFILRRLRTGPNILAFGLPQ
jgi:hypothetical protein